MGKRILLPKPVEECGYEPYSRNEENEYPEYIIGIDEYGEPRSYTSNPAKLSNYFGANPGAPHYLTPVFSRKRCCKDIYLGLIFLVQRQVTFVANPCGESKLTMNTKTWYRYIWEILGGICQFRNTHIGNSIILRQMQDSVQMR